MSEEFEVGSAVFFKCLNPATGHIKRLAKDKTWADVEWSYGVSCVGTRRAKTKNLVKLTRVLNEYLKESK